MHSSKNASVILFHYTSAKDMVVYLANKKANQY